MPQKPPEESKGQELAKIDPESFRLMTTREALAYWSALPTKARVPATQKGLASLMNVSEERLCQIKREESFKEEVMEYRKTFFRQFTSDVIHSLVQVAKMGNERAAKLFLQYVEDFQETSKQTIEKTETRKFVFELPPGKMQELRDTIKRLRKNKDGTYVEELEAHEEVRNTAKSR